MPANLRCGQPGNEPRPPTMDDPHWAPLRFTFGGVWEIEPHWLEEKLAKVQVLDVREPNEFSGPLGHIRGATLVPLGELAARAGELPKDKPIVAVCRAGSRSAHATAILQKAGFADIANLPGGMLRWRAEGRGSRAARSRSRRAWPACRPGSSAASPHRAPTPPAIAASWDRS